MVSTQLTSMLVMGALVVIVVAAVARSRPWYEYSPRSGDDTGRGSHDAERGSPDRIGLWIGLFLLAALGAVGGVVAVVSTPDLGLLDGPVVLGASALVGFYLLLGVYSLAKERGHPNALAVAETATVFGVLFLVAVSVQLIGA